MKNYQGKILFFIALCLVLIFAGCGSSGGSSDDNGESGGGSDKPDNLTFLCFTAEEDGVKVSITSNLITIKTINLSYSTDNCKTWNTFTPNATVVPLEKKGDMVYFKGNNASICETTYDDFYFSFTGKVAGSGNIMSILDETMKRQDVPDECFYGLFKDCSTLISAPSLPATNLGEGCYSNMFFMCESLEKAPELPATNLGESCYFNMFHGCTSLTTAPELPATKLEAGCYSYMFDGCKNLNSITVHFTDWVGENATRDWLNGVAPEGTFTCPSDLPEERGSDYIPTGWHISHP